MKDEKYRITYPNGKSIDVTAGCKNDAVTLANAEKIKLGENYSFPTAFILEDGAWKLA